MALAVGTQLAMADWTERCTKEKAMNYKNNGCRIRHQDFAIAAAPVGAQTRPGCRRRPQPVAPLQRWQTVTVALVAPPCLRTNP